MGKLPALAAFLTTLENPDFNAGHIQTSAQTEPGVFSLPYAVLSEVADAFVRAAYDHGWVLQEFDWPNWAQTKQAIMLRDDERGLPKPRPSSFTNSLRL